MANRRKEVRAAPLQETRAEKAGAGSDRLIRDAADARLWSRAARDPRFLAEIGEIDASLPADELSTWDD